VINGGFAPDEYTLAAIEAINKIPQTVTLAHEDIVVAARRAYDLVTSKDQQALVTNSGILLSAEKRIEAFKTPQDQPTEPDDPIDQPEKKDNSKTALIVIVIVESVIIAGGIGAAAFLVIKNKRITKAIPENTPEAAPEEKSEDQPEEKEEPEEKNEEND
jgi:hypothetical protein